MKLIRVYAYAVDPQRGAESPASPIGGAVRINASVEQVISQNIHEAKFKERTHVDVDVDTSSRTNNIRDAMLGFAFGEPAKAKASADELAMALSLAMDLRSPPSLFIIACSKKNDTASVTLWLFPRDQAYRFKSTRSGPSIDVLTDVFSKSSRLRKAALFSGRELRTDFLRGRVLDLQASSSETEVADFWIHRFLSCSLSISSESGSRLLANAVQQAFNECEGDSEAQQQIHDAFIAARRLRRRSISLAQVADDYLDGTAKSAFLRAIPNNDSRYALFTVARDVLDTTLQFMQYQLDTGVFVSSPVAQIDKSVKISDKSRLECSGQIISEKLRKRV